jgi:hypothetical protein
LFGLDVGGEVVEVVWFGVCVRDVVGGSVERLCDLGCVWERF